MLAQTGLVQIPQLQFLHPHSPVLLAPKARSTHAVYSNDQCFANESMRTVEELAAAMDEVSVSQNRTERVDMLRSSIGLWCGFLRSTGNMVARMRNKRHSAILGSLRSTAHLTLPFIAICCVSTTTAFAAAATADSAMCYNDVENVELRTLLRRQKEELPRALEELKVYSRKVKTACSSRETYVDATVQELYTNMRV